MSNLSKILAKEIIKSGGTIICGDGSRNIQPNIEWSKWLSYEPEFEKERIQYFDSKKVSELSYEELEEASRYSKNKIFARLFKIYGTNECSEDNAMKVYDYMSHESIENLMLSKLTLKELQYAKQEIARLSKVPKEQLSNKIKQDQGNYEQLSMVDSYILHYICNINYNKNMTNLKKEISAQLDQNEIMRQKSLYYAANSYIKK